MHSILTNVLSQALFQWLSPKALAVINADVKLAAKGVQSDVRGDREAYALLNAVSEVAFEHLLDHTNSNRDDALELVKQAREALLLARDY